MNKYPTAHHFGGLHNGVLFYVMRITVRGASCRPVSFGPGIATHALKVSNLELHSEGDEDDEAMQGIVRDLE